MKKVLIAIVSLIVLLGVGLFTFVSIRWNKGFEAPLPSITISTDSAIIARGQHLAFGPAHCASCHAPADQQKDIAKGKVVPLSGGWELTIPPGTFRAPNLTPDMETGIGKLSDAQIARALRYSVKHDNSLLFAFMPFQEISDADLVAIISFLRSQAPVSNKVPPTEYSFLGKALLALGAIQPVGPKNTPPATVTIDSNAVYGAYIAQSVANCVGCHTNRDLTTGAFVGEPFAGGLQLPAEGGYKQTFVAPNLTPDPTTGVIANWNEAAFIHRMKTGRIHAGSPMPWEANARMDTLELKALYRFLRSINPVAHKIPKTVYEEGEELPK